MNIRDYLKNNILITDGAIGTYYEKLYPQDANLVEEASVRAPERILEIHRQYLAAGAHILRTNTFAVNSTFFPSAAFRRDLVLESYRIASEAVRDYLRENPGEDEESYFIAADIGTIYDNEGRDPDQIIAEYHKMADVFLEAGADIFWLETQADFLYLKDIVTYIRRKCSNAFIMVSFSFDNTGYTKAGVSLSRMMNVVSGMSDVDAYGMNCGVEAAHMYQMLSRVNFPSDTPFMAVPNAGYPFLMRGRTIYGQNENYYADKMAKMPELGVDILGGCCGTTPRHIARLAQAMKDIERRPKAIDTSNRTAYEKPQSAALARIEAGEKPYIVELDPPFNTDIAKIVRGAEILREHNVDLLTLSDSPMARTRMDPVILGSMIQREVGIQVMPHLTCRDRNIISLRGTILGAHVTGIRHFLFVTGDPVNKYDRSMTSQVFDYNSVRLMGMVHEMNEDVFAGDRIVYGGALNYHGVNADAIAERMRRKMQQGCSMFLTQPIYSDEDIERITYLRKATGAKIMAGVMPLVSYKNARFMANEMPGIRIPDEVITQYTPEMTRQEAENVAVTISLDIAERLSDACDGYYFMVPFNRVELVCQIIEAIRSRQ